MEPHSGYDFSSTAFALAQRKHAAKPVSCLSTLQHNAESTRRADLISPVENYRSRSSISQATTPERARLRFWDLQVLAETNLWLRREGEVGPVWIQYRTLLRNRHSALQGRPARIITECKFPCRRWECFERREHASLAGLGLGPIWKRIVIRKWQPHVRWFCKPYPAEFDQRPSTTGVFLWPPRLQIHGYQQF